MSRSKKKVAHIIKDNTTKYSKEESSRHDRRVSKMKLKEYGEEYEKQKYSRNKVDVIKWSSIDWDEENEKYKRK